MQITWPARIAIGASTVALTVAAIAVALDGPRVAALGAPIDGTIAELYVHPGQRVARGAPLFRLDDRPLQAERLALSADLWALRARLSQAEAQGDTQNAAILTQYANALGQRLEAVTLAADGLVVTAPRDGFVLSVSAQAGEAVAAGPGAPIVRFAVR
ncbi:MAG: Barrel-sandwich domain of CusB or HlyD rane-fusion [Rhodospirillales bacterium]|jgi:multidrug resistance efflux pump|nr:Barrel-sandwich domain of CusB or HlyD rane-fusion [Rhodospirillales bacterium]